MSRSSLPFRALRPILTLALAIALAGCQRDAGPLPTPDYGSAACATCQATITAPRFAAQLQRADGTVLSFDDPACLFVALRSEAAAPRHIRFHDAGADGWIDADAAWFARVPGQATPHAGGWVAYASFAAAQDAVAAGGSGEILPFAQARERIGR
jgi:hypothetical protein